MAPFMRANNNFSVVVVNPARSVALLGALKKQNSNRKSKVKFEEGGGSGGGGEVGLLLLSLSALWC